MRIRNYFIKNHENFLTHQNFKNLIYNFYGFLCYKQKYNSRELKNNKSCIFFIVFSIKNLGKVPIKPLQSAFLLKYICLYAF